MMSIIAASSVPTVTTILTTSRHSSLLTSSLTQFLSSSSSSSLSPSPLLLRHRCRPAVPPPRARISPIVGMATIAAEPIDVIVKAASGAPDKLGDCPFTQRVLLTLEEKNIPYNVKLVDLANKPDWFLEINPEGKVPVIKNEGKWVPDSDVITQILEEKFPEPSLQTPADKALVGSKVFPSFVKFLKSKDPSDGTEEALVAELTTLNDYLKDYGPFIAGDKITAADLSLGPKLLHLKAALGHYKNWSIPSDLVYLNKYIETLFSRESFKKTRPESDDYIIAGWEKHVS